MSNAATPQAQWFSQLLSQANQDRPQPIHSREQPELPNTPLDVPAPRLKPSQIRSSLPTLLPWHQTYQASDRINKNVYMPACIVLDDEDKTTFGDRNFDTGTWLRFTPVTVTMFPAFRISIRQNHFQGQQQQEHQKMRQEHARRTGNQPTPLTKQGRNADVYPEDHVEEEFEVEPRQLEYLRIRTADAEEIRGLFGGTAQSGIVRVDYEFKRMEKPMRTLLQGMDFRFTAAPQVQLSSSLPKIRRVSLFVKVGYSQQRLVNDWRNICLPARATSFSEVDVDDWYWARHREYRVTQSVGRFRNYLEAPDLTPGLPRHLSKGDGRYRALYPIDSRDKLKPVKTHFATPSSYEEHQMVALLWERRSNRRQQELLYNRNVTYPIRFTHIDGLDYRVDIKFKPQGAVPGTAKLLPTPGTEISIALPNKTLLQNGDELSKGEVLDEDRLDFDFSAVVTLAVELDDQDFEPQPGFLYDANVLWSEHDETTYRRLAAVNLAISRYCAVPCTSTPRVQNGERRGEFCLMRIISDDDDYYYSPAYLDDWREDSNLFSDEGLDTIRDLADGLNADQRTFFDKTMTGVRSNTLILQGYPGTGKTYALAVTVVALLLMGKRVVVTSQSNNGVQALFEKILALIERHPELQGLLERLVQVRSEREEQAFAQYERSGDPRQSVQFASAKYWMASRIADYCRHNPDDALVSDYHAHIKARRERKADDSLPPWGKVLNQLRAIVFEKCLLVACTTYVAGGLNPKQPAHFKADAVFLDEAGQAVEADTLMAVGPHIGHLQLLVLCGDVQQLGPVVKSEDQNPLHRILETSTLKRLLDGWPQITRVPLTFNYRGHPSTWAMSNHIFYAGVMKPGHPVSHWNSELSHSIVRTLKQKLTRATRYPLHALDFNNRQLFLNVDSPSEQEADGTSYFNAGGILAVVGLVKMLHEGGVSLRDMGVITMYKEDLRLLVQQLEMHGFDDVEVGRVDIGDGVRVATVDSFQGKEKPVMIVHFVAAHKYGPGGNPFGFVKQQLRLNVAATRSQEYQFLVGNMSCWQPWRVSRTTDDCKHIAQVIDWITKSHQVVEWDAVEELMGDERVRWISES